MTKNINNRPWLWVPSLYFAEGIPYIIVMTLSVILYKRLGVSNTDIALYTSWLYLPWVIKPFWSPIVDILKTKRFWIIIMQLIVGGGLAGVAFTIPVESFFQYTLAFFWLLAFSSATHDIAADGFYMLGLSQNQQAFFVGIRATFYRLAMLTGQGLIVIFAGYFETSTGLKPVEFEIRATNNNIENRIFIPEIVPTGKGVENEIYTISKIDVSTVNPSKSTIDSLLNFAKNENLKNSFYEPDKPLSPTKETWWKANISKPLQLFLKNKFNKNDSEIETKEGNIALIGFKLLNKPTDNKPIIINFSLKSGDNSIKLVEGNRFEFTEFNYNKIAYSAVQLDSKLKKETFASFVGLSGNIPLAWTFSFVILAVMFVVFCLYHKFVLPRPESDVAATNDDGILKNFIQTFVSFFAKPGIGLVLAVLLLYRFGESQLVKLASPFLIDAREVGGLGLTTGDLGLVYGTCGMLALTIGGILGGILAARKGLKYWLWWMVIAMNVPNVVYVYLSFALPESLVITAIAVAIEQFGYGFGFTAYMLYMIYISEGKHKTAHFAIATGFMALGMMLPGMLSGWLQEIIGYKNFFVWVIICTIPIFFIIPFLKIDPKYGIKKTHEN